MIRIRNYRAGDEWLITPVEEMSNILRGHSQYTELWRKRVNPKSTWTGERNSVVIALGGVLDNGVMWLMIDKYSTRYKKDLLRLIKQGFQKAVSYNGFQKFTTFVKKDVDKTEGIFARHFGFKVAKEQQFQGIDYLVYEWQTQQH